MRGDGEISARDQSMVIFFDVDGVLNRKEDWRIPFTIHNECVKHFAEFVEKAKKKKGSVKLVIVSTWRAGKSKNGNDAKQYVALEQKLKQYSLAINDSTPLSNKSRQAEVEYYIRRNMVRDYIVIDDDRSLYENHIPSNVIFHFCLSAFVR